VRIQTTQAKRVDLTLDHSWFGLILLPIVSYVPNGAVAVGYAVRKSIRVYLGLAVPKPPTTLAKGKAIDLSIQFMLLWMPFLVVLGWILNKPMTLLFGTLSPVSRQ
jgi:Ca2+:H+ antiporter